MGAPSQHVSSPWLSLGEASRFLGITPATLRRWADHGDVAAFVTPGGHRRFPRTVIEDMVPKPRSRRPTLTGLHASATRVAQAYRRATPPARPAGTPWISALSDGERAGFRERGHRMLALLLEHLNDEDSSAGVGKLGEATAAANEYGRHAAELGASLAETVEAFVRFRSAFVGELASIARRRRLATHEATALLVKAECAVDQLLVALINGHAARRL